MQRRLWCVRVAVAASLAAAFAIPSASPSTVPSQDTRRNTMIGHAKKIDRYLASKWKSQRIAQADPAGDYEFCRRAYLDLVGAAPTIEELESYARNDAKDKAYELIDYLVASERFDRHWGETFTNLFFGYRDGEHARRDDMLAWLTAAVQRNMPYHLMVRDLIGARGNTRDNKETSFVLRWLDNDARQEITNRISKLFVGVKISCAACHDHPFAKWKRDHFYQLSTFFFRSKWTQVGENDDKDKYWTVEDDYKGARTISFAPPGFNKAVAPTFLSGLKPQGDNLREELGNLIVGDPQFVRASANRLWSMFFHRGIVDPPDDFSERNKPTAPDLLNMLTAKFVEFKFDLRTMVRMIAYTDAYRLSSLRPANEEKKEAEAEELFAVRPLRVLLPNQLFDTIAATTRLDKTGRFKDKPADLARLRRAFLEYAGPNYEDEFAPRGEMNFSMQQLIRLMTWKELYVGIEPDSGGIVSHVMAKARERDERIGMLYRSMLGRPPSERELEVSSKFVQEQGDRPPAYSRLAFALMQTNEYFFHH
jgi:hypothetical protein